MGKDNSEKMKALEAALGQIEKQFGKGSVMKLGDYTAMNVESIPTGALSLDIALGIGGIPRGRIIEVFGPESSGKTTLPVLKIYLATYCNKPQPFLISSSSLSDFFNLKVNSIP